MGCNRCSEVLQRFAQLIQALCPLWRFRALTKARLRALLESDAAVPAKAPPAECDVSKGFPASLGNRGDSEERAASGRSPNVQSGNRGSSKRHAASSDSRGDSRDISAFPGVRGDAGRHSMLSGCRGDSMEPFSSGVVGDVASSLCHAGAASITVPSAIGMYLPGSCKAALARSASSACNVM